LTEITRTQKRCVPFFPVQKKTNQNVVYVSFGIVSIKKEEDDGHLRFEYHMSVVVVRPLAYKVHKIKVLLFCDL
jgi:hypothetical protein